jgi:hypothetical protein
VDELDLRRLGHGAAGAADQLAVHLAAIAEAKPILRLRVEVQAVGPRGSDVGDVGTLPGVDIEALSFLVLMEAGRSANDDLRAIMQDVQAINRTRAMVLASTQPNVAPPSKRETDIDTAIAILLTAYGVDFDRDVEGLMSTVDPAGEMSEETELRLQMAMDRLTKMMSTLSNILKKLADTSDAIIQNLK